MSTRTSQAYVLSVFLHGLVVAAILLLAYLANQTVVDQPKVLELVAGAGDNYGATEAPAIGVPGGIKATLPAMPVVPPQPEPAAETPTPPQTVPIEPVPVEQPAHHPSTAKPKPVPTKTRTPTPTTFKRVLQHTELRRKLNLERKYKKEQETYEKFEREQAAKTAARSARVDAEGIREGVVGGSTHNKTGGASGTALAREEADAFAAYWAMFRERLKENHVPPPDVSNQLEARVEFYMSSEGAVSRYHIVKSSGNAEFDRSVLEAFARVRMPRPPDGRGGVHDLTFSMRDEEAN